MTRDYARRSFKRKKSKKKSRYLLILLFLIFALGLVLLHKHQKLIADLIKIKPTEIKASPENKTATIAKKITTPKFDFYSILPAPAKKSGNAEIEYELEITVVNDFAAADRLKAELSLLGFVVSITPTYSQGIQKYHVSIGPYDNEAGANADQQKLKQNKIKSTLKKLH
jgi:cell division protein FtsN